MAQLTHAQIAAIREWVGPTDVVKQEDLTASWNIHADINLVSRAILRTRRARILASAAKFSVEGDYSEDNTETLRRLDTDIADLSTLIDGATIPGEDPTATGSARMYRPDIERLFTR